MNEFIPVSANWVGNPVPNGGDILWIFNQMEEQWKVARHAQFQAGGDGKQAWEALLVAGFGLAQGIPPWDICNAMVWGGNKWWRADLDHSIHQDSEDIICATSLTHAQAGFPRFLCYSWLEAVTVCLRKRLWMGPDLFPSLQIMGLLYCLHLNKRDLDVISAFCMLEQCA